METRQPSKQRLEDQIKEHVKEYLANGGKVYDYSTKQVRYNADVEDEDIKE